MGRKAIGKANRFSSLLNAEIRAEIAKQRKTLRALEEETGISKSRLGMVINQDEAPMNTNELDAISKALGTKAYIFLRKAEEALTRSSYDLAAYTSDEEKGIDAIE